VDGVLPRPGMAASVLIVGHRPAAATCACPTCTKRGDTHPPDYRLAAFDGHRSGKGPRFVSSSKRAGLLLPTVPPTTHP